MSAHQAQHRIATMCRALEVSTSGYHAWRARPASKRAREDGVLLRQIRTAHAASRETYGVPPVWRELRDAGVAVGRDRVARLMRAAGLRRVSRRRWAGFLYLAIELDASGKPAQFTSRRLLARRALLPLVARVPEPDPALARALLELPRLAPRHPDYSKAVQA